jgi:FkbM family methyltransferase
MDVKSKALKVLSNSALWLHILHRDAYSAYKIYRSGLITDFPLTSLERLFYLQLQPLLRDKSLVIYDIGAAKGIVSSCLAKLPNVISIESFEPIPEVYNSLIIEMQRYSNVRCHNVALGNSEGLLPMYINSKSDSSSLLKIENLHNKEFPGTDIQSQINIPVVRLDEYVKQYKLPLPNIVKIDVQGYEMNVLEGGIDTISQSKYCVLEMSFKPLYQGSPLFDDIYVVMRKLGFQLIGVTSPLKGESETQLQVDGFFENKRFSLED